MWRLLIGSRRSGSHHGSRRRGASAFAAAAAALLLLAAPLPARQQPQPYRGGIDLVSVYATVTDRNQRLVTDLKKDDFEVYDNGRKQTLTFFSNDVQPITAVVMLDRSGSMAEHFDLVQRAAGEFINRLSPADRARIGNFSQEILIQPGQFTSDHDELLGVLKNGLQEIGPSPVWTAIDRSITALLNEGGRRVVIVFTDGHDQPLDGQVHTDVKDVEWRTQYDEIMVYAIGLKTPGSGGWASPFAVRRGRIQIQRGARPTGPEAPDPGLRKLAELSGGGYFELDWSADLTATFARVAEELHHQYALGFPPRKLDDDEHALEVRVNRPDLVVRARKSYVAAVKR